MHEFSKVFHARWGDMDFNGHMRNTAFLDACGDIRMMFFAEHGFAMADFARLGIGPVIRRDELDYFRELRLLDPVRVTLLAAGQSEDGSQFRILNEFWRDDGRKAASVLSTGGWLDLQRRRFVAPPDALLAAMRQMPAAETIEALPSLVRPG